MMNRTATTYLEASCRMNTKKPASLALGRFVVGAFAVGLYGAMAGATATTAAAEPMAAHVVGDQCIGADIGRKDLTPSGRPIICDSNYHWEPNMGQAPNDPWVTAQNP